MIVITYATVQVKLINIKSRKRRTSRITPSPIREFIPIICPRNISLRSVRPINWSHIFRDLFFPSRACPWEWLDEGFFFKETEADEDALHGALLVESVEVETVDTVGDEFLRAISGVVVVVVVVVATTLVKSRKIGTSPIIITFIIIIINIIIIIIIIVINIVNADKVAF